MNSDLDAIAADHIAVTPLQLDLTHDPSSVMLNEAYR
jgi:5'-nucleotidase